MAYDRKKALKRRHRRVRSKIHGTALRPRLCIHKSLRHIYAQVVDDKSGRTLVSSTTNHKTETNEGKSFRNVESAKKLGREIGQKAIEKGVEMVVFDRGGARYHGVVKAFADAAREAGLKF